MYQLEPNESSADGIRRIIDEQIAESLALLTDSSGNRDVAIHETRKKLKRIRAALRLLRGTLDEPLFQQENGRFRHISHHLAPLRDSFVRLETLDSVEVCGEQLVDYNGYAQIRQQLVAQYEAVRDHFWGSDEIIETAVTALHNAQTIPLPISATGFAPFAPGLRRTYRNGRHAMTQAYANPADTEMFHTWRKRVKDLWHQMELLHLLWPGYLAELEIQLHELSGHLGQAHDLAELAHTLTHHPHVFPPSPALAALQQHISQRRQQLEMAAQPIGQRLYAERPFPFIHRFTIYHALWQPDAQLLLNA